MYIGAATMENNMEVPKGKKKKRTTILSSNCTSGYFSKENKNINSKSICTPMFIAALFTIAKIWKKPKCLSINEWINNI